MQALKTYLNQQKLTRSAFAKRMGVKPAAVHYWIEGKRKPGHGMARKIHAVTGIPLAKIRPDWWGNP